MTFSAEARRIADRIALAVTALWIAYEVVQNTLFGKHPFPSSIVDYSLMYRLSREIIRAHRYPAGPYPYPPSSVILQYCTAVFPFAVSAAIWMALTAIAAAGCWWMLIKMLGLQKSPGALVVIPFAYAFSSYFFHWDLTQQNSNVIFLAMTIAGVFYAHKSRPVPAGVGVALSISFKLYSFLLVPYLLWTRRYRAFAWTIASLAFFWIALPAAAFGVKGSAEVYNGWFRQLRISGGYDVNQYHPVLISLVRSANHLFPADPGHAALLVNAFRAAWLALLVIVCILARNRAEGTANAFALLSDVGVLVLAPVALSPYLEPYHAVAVAIPGLLLLMVAAGLDQKPRDQASSAPASRVPASRDRLLAAIFFAAAFLVLAIPSPWEIRGLMVNLKLLLATAGTATIASLRYKSGSAPIDQTNQVSSPAAANLPVRPLS